jgi:hypothetical protein
LAKGKTSCPCHQAAAVAVIMTMMTKAINHNSDFLCNYHCHLKTISAYNSLASPILSSPHDDVGIYIFK